MNKEQKPVFVISDQWDNKTLETAILKSAKGGKMIHKNKVSVYSDKVVTGKIPIDRVSEE